ncbi:MAG: anti-sigma F factor [Acutalibacteraceae bacterium]|nr:anti-sigma F factor [Acutalibacteraceae bacterium]
MKLFNEMQTVIDSKSINEGFSRVAVSAFISCLDPNVEELTDIKTAVSEAVTNAIVHGYKEKQGKIYITVSLFENNNIRIRIRDKGVGIEDVPKAMEPLYTTAGSERAGLGFAVMESFMDKVRVTSKPGKGTTVTMEKRIWGKNI